MKERTLNGFHKLTANGVEWVYRPNVRYSGVYRGYTITITRCPAEKNWRLMVSVGSGIGLSFKKQFHPTTAAARSFGIMLVDLKLDKNETPYQ